MEELLYEFLRQLIKDDSEKKSRVIKHIMGDVFVKRLSMINDNIAKSEVMFYKRKDDQMSLKE